MKESVDFQSHSLFHPILTICSDDEYRRETFQSKKDIEALLGKECKHFSYPNGGYTEREIKFTKDAGYLSARTLDIGWNNLDTDLYRLNVMSISDDASLNLLIAQMSGITGYLRHLMKGSLTRKHRPIRVDERKEE